MKKSIKEGNISKKSIILADYGEKPYKIYDEKLELLKSAYSKGIITGKEVKVALERGEITILQAVKILNNQYNEKPIFIHKESA